MANREFEDKYIKLGNKYICGLDEAGRGPLAGPLVVACVILPNDYNNDDINDSKKLSAKKRQELFNEIIDKCIEYTITIYDNNEVDKLNPYKASQLGMSECVRKLKTNIDIVLTDAMPLPSINKPVIDIIKGDAKSISIAAASILAKVTRDNMMVEYDKEYPQYDFKSNKGYGTKKHIDAIYKYGITPIHRKSYEPIKTILNPPLKFDFDEDEK